MVQAAELVAAAGRVVQLGLCRDEVTFPGSIFVRKKNSTGSARGCTQDGPAGDCADASGAVDPRPLITHRMSLDQAEEAFKLMAEKPGEVTKIVLSLSFRQSPLATVSPLRPRRFGSTGVWGAALREPSARVEASLRDVGGRL